MAEKKAAKKVQISIEAMAATLLLIVLAGLTMLLISSTGRSYKNIVSSGTSEQSIRTSLSFISTKVRQSDSGGNISVSKSPFGGNAVVIAQTANGKIYENWIFYYNGALREATVPKGDPINGDACAAISKLHSLSVSQSGKSIEITAGQNSTDKNGNPITLSQSLVLTPRT